MSSGVRFAILVNDFGDLNIDASLIASHKGETISLTNGCICCNMVDGFVETMIKLMKRIDEFDQIVIEASGVSEPDRIMDIARLDPELIPNGIIIMIDGVNIRNQIEDPYVGKIVLEQMKSAEIQIINKSDLLETEELNDLEDWIAMTTPSPFRVVSTQGKVSLPLIFGFIEEIKKDGSNSQHNQSSQNAEPNPLPFKSVSLKSQSILQIQTFKDWVDHLPDSVIRGKGVLQLENNPLESFIWQKVGKNYSLTKFSTPLNNEGSELLLIGNPEMPSLEIIGIPTGFYEV